MIAYAACVLDEETFREACLPGIARAAGSADLVVQADAERSVDDAYDEVLAAMRERSDLEALVLLDQEAEVLDPGLGALVLHHLADPDVALVGADGDDGLLLALSPWAVRHLSFGDGDVAEQARAAGKRVALADLPVARHVARGAGVRDAHGDDGYFEHTRPELRALVPATARRVLDVGCGGGALGAALKAERGCEVVGIEGFPEAAARARRRLDDAWCLDLDAFDGLPDGAGTFDAMIFGDVLEHLLDPERLLRALLPSLADDGVIVCSIPNVKHWSVLLPLLVHDHWTYEDAGLLDRTHVHFFTLEEISALLDDLGLEGVHVGVNDHAPLPASGEPLADLAASLGTERAEAAARLGAYQYLVVARRAPGGAGASGAAAPAGTPAVRFGAPDHAALAALVPAAAERVLDVGALGAASLETLETVPGDGTHDALVLGDALEHVRDPERLLRALLPSLAPDGVIVGSVPNVGHWSVVLPLLVEDRWPYADRGLLDRSHLRFLTRNELSTLLEGVGLEVVAIEPDRPGAPPEAARFADLACGYGADRTEALDRLGTAAYRFVARVRTGEQPAARPAGRGARQSAEATSFAARSPERTAPSI